jgi:hypothetical protein
MAKAIVTCTDNGIRFYLTDGRLATDIPGRACAFRDGTDAALAAIQERREPAWQTQDWEPAFLMSDGTVVPLAGAHA